MSNSLGRALTAQPRSPFHEHRHPARFVAATHQNDGKTTALGLFAAFRKRRGRIGYIRPVGQRFVEAEGKQIDEDAMLIEDSFYLRVPLEDMNPIAVEPDFTREYNWQIHRRGGDEQGAHRAARRGGPPAGETRGGLSPRAQGRSRPLSRCMDGPQRPIP